MNRSITISWGKRFLPFAFIIGLFLFATTAIQAAGHKNSISLGRIAYSGNACPSGSVSARLNGGNEQLVINFKQYVVESRGRNQRNIKKTCNIALPIIVPEGISVSLVSANYTGQVSLPKGSHVRFMNAYSFRGRRGSRFRADIHGPHHQGYTFHDPLSSFASIWSACGRDTILRITTSTRIKTNGADGKSLADPRQGLMTQLRYRSCQ